MRRRHSRDLFVRLDLSPSETSHLTAGVRLSKPAVA